MNPVVKKIAKVAVTAVKTYAVEYVRTLVDQKVAELEERYPEAGLGALKLAAAKDDLIDILGSDYVEEKWESLKRRFANAKQMFKARFK